MNEREKKIELDENGKVVLDSDLLVGQLLEKLWKKKIINWDTYKSALQNLKN